MLKKTFTPFNNKIWLSSPTMHGEELKYMTEAYETNWMSTVGANINEVERLTAEKVGCKYAVALSCGTAALHLAMKLAGVKPGDKVFCSDMTFDATVNPVVYRVFIIKELTQIVLIGFVIVVPLGKAVQDIVLEILGVKRAQVTEQGVAPVDHFLFQGKDIPDKRVDQRIAAAEVFTAVTIHESQDGSRIGVRDFRNI